MPIQLEIFIKITLLATALVASNTFYNRVYKPYVRKKAIQRLLKIFVEPVFRGNSQSNVLALCSNRAFTIGLANRMSLIQVGTPESAQEVKIWIADTYTFFLQEDQRRVMHTGTKRELEIILARVVLKYTGQPIQYWKARGCDVRLLEDIIMKKDRRLFVPFAGDTPYLEKQLRVYNKRLTVEDLYEEFVL
ncbi:MAG: hypothetical protein NTV02_03045 [Candidatus Zambryskibacteria bacterium]|nr:hypothetical protein [Candidatus Zambryskibacteria bacterium]